MPEHDPVRPPVILDRIYTRGGDKGDTSLADGTRVSKDAPRICCCGDLDELSAFVGAARVEAVAIASQAPLGHLVSMLERIQHQLFNLGAALASPGKIPGEGQAFPEPSDIEFLEREIDALNRDLPPLKSFVLPGAAPLDAELHRCRAVCRRAERSLVALSAVEPVPPHALPYLNRLSDAFFVWARWACRQLGAGEILWDPKLASPQRDASSGE